MSSPLTIVGTIFLATFTSYYILVTWTRNRRAAEAIRVHGCKSIPRVQSWDPILGLDTFIQIQMADAAGRRSEAYRALHRKYGQTFLVNSLGTELQTSQPENIQAICTSSFNDWGVGPMRGTIGIPFLGRGIFTEDGEFWKHSRSLVRPTFSRAEIADLENFESHVARFLTHIPKDGSTFDMLPLVKRLFLDTSTEFLFGDSTECLAEQTPVATDVFMKSFDRSLLGLALLLIFRPIRWPLYFDPWWKEAYTNVHAFVDKRVSLALEKQRSADKEAGPKRYVLLEEMAKITQDPYDLRMHIINVFFPARDTAAIAFGDIIFELARHPAEWKKLKAEVDSISATQALSFEFLRSLKVTKAIINESLRLHPAASRLGKISLKDTVLPKGGGEDGRFPIFVPKGTVVELDLYTLQRDPTIWGADADIFRPDRWLDVNRPLWEAKWQYEPFLGGIRMCPAQNQVLIQLSYLLVRLAQEIQLIENRDEVFEYLERVTMTVESKNGAKIAVKYVN
ncbi:uncharacterized protein EAF02_002305 [Botrytis sinoallii]|uniref:uncharacterized protein n=1 Tax=Botrytis sinoallii TaxID=1463999 RepID=UPI00190157A6|nr:uncharacterized protein EAF02_002305 [Botrytis sinoallii]KAF7889890.1 hypothetical protein EAF02_002305 [Botrytis sinoallii]